MDVRDYYTDSIVNKISYGLGRGARTMSAVTQNVSPVKATASVAVLWGSVAALVNLSKYRHGKVTKREAVVSTANESAGMGLSAGLGLFTSNLLRTYILGATAASVLPFTIGVAVTAGTKVMWDCTTKNKIKWCGSKKGRKQVVSA